MMPIDQCLPPLARRLAQPRILLPLLNLLGGAALGHVVLGGWGLLVGPMAVAACAALPWLGRRLAVLTLPQPGPTRPLPSPLTTTLGVAEAAWPERVLAPVLHRVAACLGGFLAEGVLPLTVLNLVLLALLGCLIQGIDFAFWLALGAVPVILIGLMLMALDGQREPDDSSEEEAA